MRRLISLKLFYGDAVVVAIHSFLGADEGLEVEYPAIAKEHYHFNAVLHRPKTNSTCGSMSRRVNSLRFCIPFVHSGAERIGEAQRIVIGLHPLPGCFRQAIPQQRKVHSFPRDAPAHRCRFVQRRTVLRFFSVGLDWPRLHCGEITHEPGAVKDGCRVTRAKGEVEG